MTRAVAQQDAKALAFLRISVGVLFLIFGQYKVFGSQFTLGGGFQQWIHRFLEDGAYPFMVPILRGFVLPHGTAISFLVAYGELAIGLALVLGLLVRTGSAFGCLYMLVLLFSSNYPGPHAELWQYFGASLDHLVLALCFAALLLGGPADIFTAHSLFRRWSSSASGVPRWGMQPSGHLEGRKMDFEEFYRQTQFAWNEFARGNPEPAKALYSHREDATLANPFGPAVRGWKQVSRALEYASSRFREGEFVGAERIAEHATADLVCLVDLEHWKAKVGERKDVELFDLRVTTILRREDDDWQIVHRHADPITTFDPAGPMRSSLG